MPIIAQSRRAHLTSRTTAQKPLISALCVQESSTAVKNLKTLKTLKMATISRHIWRRYTRQACLAQHVWRWALVGMSFLVTSWAEKQGEERHGMARTYGSQLPASGWISLTPRKRQRALWNTGDTAIPPSLAPLQSTVSFFSFIYF